MAKKAFIVDDVSYCIECPLFSGVRCWPLNKKPPYEDIENKVFPEFCPLKDVPEEKPEVESILLVFNNGWNACRKALLGGKNETESTEKDG